MKKIGILTLPIKTNYGGILQAYALLAFLKKQGYDAWFIRRRWNSEGQGLIHKLSKWFYHTIIIRKFNKFINQYIQPQTEVIDTRGKVKTLLNRGFDAFVVGSDQIWRMRHVYGADYNYFLDFTSESQVKRIAYAASFGVDFWDDTHPEQSIPIVKELLKKFNSISVRENSGIGLCQSLFNVDAMHVIDPTLLLDKEEYIDNFELQTEYEKKYLAVYILDTNKDKEKIITSISKKIQLPIKQLNIGSDLVAKFLPSQLSELVKPGVKEWLNGLLNADYVITDSFHGLVFSIIFEKQFMVIGNKRRGLTRFVSLLSLFGLEKRLVMNFKEFTMNLDFLKTIKYEYVRSIKEIKQKEALAFIKRSIKDEK